MMTQVIFILILAFFLFFYGKINFGFLFKWLHLCVPRGPLKTYIIQEMHGGGLSACVGKDKTIALVEERFYWLYMRRDITKHVQRCLICQTAKGVA